MRLLVKRDETSKSGVFGGTKRQFLMTLKLELSPEEQAAVEKFDLQGEFNVENPAEKKASFTYQELIAGKTMSAAEVRDLLLYYDLVRSKLDAANSVVKAHQLFPGEQVVEIA